MGTVTIAGASDYSGHLYRTGASGSSYATVHDAADNTTPLQPTLEYFNVGQEYDGSKYYVYRGVEQFNTAQIGGGAITSALIRFSPLPGANTIDITVVDGTGVSWAVVASDYGLLRSSTTSCGTASSGDMTENVDYDIPLNAAGLALINKTGYTYFAFRSNHDIASSADSGLGYLLRMYNGKHVPPMKLIVTLGASLPQII